MSASGFAVLRVDATDGLLAVGERVTFRASPGALGRVPVRPVRPERRAAHLALAEATNRDVDPDRRAWHLAAAATGPDEEVARELELSARRAQARGGLAAAAALLQRAVALTGDPARRAARALAAAQASLGAGAFDVARGLLAAADAGPLDELGRARVDLLRAEVAFAQNRGGDAPQLLLQAARQARAARPAPRPRHLSRRVGRSSVRGSDAHAGGSLLDVSRAVSRCAGQAWPPASARSAVGRLGARSSPRGCQLRRPRYSGAVAAFAGAEVSVAGDVAVGLAGDAGGELPLGLRQRSGDRQRALSQLARDSGALEVLAVADNVCGQAAAFGGDFASAAVLVAEVDAVKEATGTRIAPYAAIALAALRGREAEAAALIDGVIADATASGQGTAVQYAHWANSVLMNGLGRYEDALAAAAVASEHTPELFIAAWALSELIESATRTENADARPPRPRPAR